MAAKEQTESFSRRIDSKVSERRKTVLEGKRESHVKFITVGEDRKRLSQEERAAASKVPLDMLAKEWLNQKQLGMETRCYLVEKLLPTLVMGLEKLLSEVTARDLVESIEHEPDFNPINFVAQYLMRNNPHYSNFAEAHPYCRTMHLVSEELKRTAYSSLEADRLSELRDKSKERCQGREEIVAERLTEDTGRRERLSALYGEWVTHGEQVIRGIDVSVLIVIDMYIIWKCCFGSLGEECFAVLDRKYER